ncbi:MAG: hypothetical protein AAGB15_01480 [Pseudomonadota bacterium]
MTRIPRIKRKSNKRPDGETAFQASSGTRLQASVLCAVLAVLFLINQTQLEGEAILLRLLSVVCMVFFAVLAWYFWRRGRRRGPVIRVGPEGFGIAVGFDTWLEFPWDDVAAFRYWEPTGLAMLIKRRQSRWIGILINRTIDGTKLTWDARFEIWLNKFHNRPGLCLLHPFVKADILDVLQAFKTHAPRRADDYTWMSR